MSSWILVPVLLLAAFSITRLEFFVVGFVLLVAPLGWLAVTKAGSRRVEHSCVPSQVARAAWHAVRSGKEGRP